MKIDSAVYPMKDGTKLVFFALSESINTENQVNVQFRSFNTTNTINKISVGDTLTVN